MEKRKEENNTVLCRKRQWNDSQKKKKKKVFPSILTNKGSDYMESFRFKHN